MFSTKSRRTHARSFSPLYLLVVVFNKIHVRRSLVFSTRSTILRCVRSNCGKVFFFVAAQVTFRWASSRHCLPTTIIFATSSGSWGRLRTHAKQNLPARVAPLQTPCAHSDAAPRSCALHLSGKEDDKKPTRARPFRHTNETAGRYAEYRGRDAPPPY